MIHIPTKKFNTYLIKPHDTLESISLALGKRTDEVIRFHNMFANDEEIISFEFTENLKVLYISPYISEKQIDKVPKVEFLYDKKLALKPFYQKLHYAVKSVVVSDNHTITIDCEKSVVFLEKISEYFLYEIDNKSNADPNVLLTMMDELNFEVAKALYPLEILVNDNGNWIGIYNFRKIFMRWEVLKQNILDEFEGEEIDKRILFYDKVFQNEIQLTALLQKDIFLKVYFNGIFANHTHVFNFETLVNFPIITNVKNVEYKINQQIEEYINEANQIEIKQEGEANDERSLMDYEYELDEPCFSGTIPQGKYKAHYLLNSKSNSIEKIDFECSLNTNVMNIIKFTAEIKIS
ncbi:hypothetical protein [Flavobacterium sp.]|uniref:hypothetical protein n=1 Tax=Flavobacterium sp. TaxID=239 RepID=UPI00375139FE